MRTLPADGVVPAVDEAPLTDEPVLVFCKTLGGVAKLDAAGTVMWASARFAAQLATPWHVLVGAPCSLLGSDAMPTLAVMTRLASGHPWHAVVSGPTGPLQCTALPYPQPGQGMLLLLAPDSPSPAAFDIFARLVRAALHELKTPLAGAYLALDLLDIKVARTHSAHDIAAQARERLNRCLAIMGEISHFAQPRPPRLQALDLAALLAGMLRPSNIPASWGTVHLHGAEHACPLTGDPGLIKEILLRLIDNAADASAGEPITVTLAVDAGWSLTTIDDRGPGMSDATAGQVGTPFYSTKPGKLGLSLALAQRLALGHGGTVTLQRRGPDGGTRATLRLPRTASPTE